MSSSPGRRSKRSKSSVSVWTGSSSGSRPATVSSTSTSMSRSGPRTSRPGAPSTISGRRRIGQRDFLDLSGRSIFYKNEAGEIFHTYSAYGRGGEEVLGIYGILRFDAEGPQRERPVSLAHRLGASAKHVRARAVTSSPMVATMGRPAAARRMPQLKPDCAGDGDDEVQQGDDGRGVGPEAAGRGGPRDPREGLSRPRASRTSTTSAGLTKGAFFHHFASTEACAIAAAEHPAS